jgi:hypothetical protein
MKKEGLAGATSLSLWSYLVAASMGALLEGYAQVELMID